MVKNLFSLELVQMYYGHTAKTGLIARTILLPLPKYSDNKVPALLPHLCGVKTDVWHSSLITLLLQMLRTVWLREFGVI